MRVKDKTVKLQGISPEIIFAMIVADQVAKAKFFGNGEELVITSANDGEHSETSLHYSGNAFDMRTRFWDQPTIENVAREIKERLGIDYDVVIEKDHIHIEFQPRKR